MTPLMIIGATVVAAVLLFQKAQRKILIIHDRFLESAISSIRQEFINISEEYEQHHFDLFYAREKFNWRSEEIILSYCEHAYGGFENTPIDKYTLLRRQVEKLNKNFMIANAMVAV